jgi:hypothetical protein
MIIVMTTDEKHIKHAGLIATCGNENIGSSSSSKIQDIELFDQVDFSKIESERLTFIGHGSQQTFGSKNNFDEVSSGLSPQDFVKKLLEKGLPKTVKTIDLFGCNIGLIDENNSSYVKEVADLLLKTPNCSHIAVNAITSDKFASTLNDQKLSRMILSTRRKKQSSEDSKIDEITIHVSGVLEKNGEKYKDFLTQEKDLNNHLENMRFQCDSLKNMDLTKITEQVQKNTSQQINKYEQEITKMEANLTALKNQRHSLRINLVQGEAFFKYLDSNPIVSTSHSANLLATNSSNSSTEVKTSSNVGQNPNNNSNVDTQSTPDADSSPKRGSIINNPFKRLLELAQSSSVSQIIQHGNNINNKQTEKVVLGKHSRDVKNDNNNLNVNIKAAQGSDSPPAKRIDGDSDNISSEQTQTSSSDLSEAKPKDEDSMETDDNNNVNAPTTPKSGN